MRNSLSRLGCPIRAYIMLDMVRHCGGILSRYETRLLGPEAATAQQNRSGVKAAPTSAS